MKIRRKQIRNMHDGTPNGRRFCDVLVGNDGKAVLQVKVGNRYDSIPWLDVVAQVNAALDMAE